jgi:hypothetical protein
MGCHINPCFCFPDPSVSEHIFTTHKTVYEAKPVGLTNAEKDVLKHLVEAWKKYAALEGHVNADLTEFTYAIHLAQQLLALRVARRVDTDVWVQPQEDNEK